VFVSVGEREAKGVDVQLDADALLSGTFVGLFRRLRNPDFWACICRGWDFWHRVESCRSCMYRKSELLHVVFRCYCDLSSFYCFTSLNVYS